MTIKDLVNVRAVALFNGVILVKDKKHKTQKPDSYIDALQRELANVLFSIIPADDLSYITREDIDETYRILRSKVINDNITLVNPEYPKLVKINFPDTFLELNKKIINISNCNDNVKIMTTQEFRQYLKEKLLAKKDCSLECAVLFNNEKDEALRILYRNYMFYSESTGKLSIPRKNRKEILKSIDDLKISKLSPGTSKAEIMLWKKLGRVLHPGEFATEFPSAYIFFDNIREAKIKTPCQNQPEKLHNLLWKAWKSWKEDIALENYLSRDIRVLDILETLRIYDIRPGITRYKKFSSYLHEFKILGNKEPSEEEIEIVEIIKLELKNKILDSLKETGKTKHIPEDWKFKPAWELLYPRYRVEVPRSFYIKNQSSNSLFITKFVLKTREKRKGIPFATDEGKLIFIKEYLSECEKILVFIVKNPKKEAKGIHQLISVEDSNNLEKIWETRIDTNSSGILAFVYYPEFNILEWIGESTKFIYSGSPDRIENLEEWDKLIQIPDPLGDINLNLYDLAKKLYTPTENGEILTMEDLLCELKT